MYLLYIAYILEIYNKYEQITTTKEIGRGHGDQKRYRIYRTFLELMA